MKLNSSRSVVALYVLCIGCGTNAGSSPNPSLGGGAGFTGGAGVNSAGASGASASGGSPAGGHVGSGGVPGAGGLIPPIGFGGTTPGVGGAIIGAGGSLGGGGRLGMGGSVGGAPGNGGVVGNGGVPPSGGAGAGGAPPAGDVCALWKSTHANMTEGAWNGNADTCDPGDLAQDVRDRALALLNMYRTFAGLPTVTLDAELNRKDQLCALIIRANNMLTHTPASTSKCYSADGATASSSSNITTGTTLSSIGGYMVDPGNPTTIGHRRWILSNSLGPVGVGGTDRSSCLWTLNGSGRAGKPWMAWPPAGKVPLQALTAQFAGTVDSTGWSIQSDSISLANAQVTVTSDGMPMAVTVTQLGANYGSRYAIRFNPMGWTTAAGKKYSVSVSGVTPAITYDVEVVDCP